MKTPTIFQVEDNGDFIFLMEYALAEIDKRINLIISCNAAESIQLLNNYRDNDLLPDVILLDINLPGLSGLDLLRVIRDNAAFDHVPIVVFSTSDNPKDVTAALRFGANEFKIKPIGYRDLVDSLRSLYKKYVIPEI